nr:MAG: putative nonstructural protein [Red panda feces-associated parvovirus]
MTRRIGSILTRSSNSKDHPILTRTDGSENLVSEAATSSLSSVPSVLTPSVSCDTYSVEASKENRPAFTKRLSPNKKRTIEDFLDDISEDVEQPLKREKVRETMLRICLENEITNHVLLQEFIAKNPEFVDLLFYDKTSTCSKIFEIVSIGIANRPFRVFWNDCYKPSNLITSVDIVSNKVIDFLVYTQNYGVYDALRLLKSLFKVINRDNGKKNCFMLLGPSSSGKSMFLKRFVDLYWPNCYGKPNNNPRTQFTFEDCLFKRVILWEEPFINDDNVEDVKLLFGGEEVKADKKYSSGICIRPTPVFVTSNKSLSQHNISNFHHDALNTRIDRFSFPSVCSSSIRFTKSDFNNAFFIMMWFLMVDSRDLPCFFTGERVSYCEQTKFASEIHRAVYEAEEAVKNSRSKTISVVSPPK